MGAEFVDDRGIVAATEKAMGKALRGLRIGPDFVLIDYFKLPSWPKEKQLPLKQGDSLSISIAAASILAKVSRDAQMEELAARYPGYGFEFHKGYGTKRHQEGIRNLGPCEIHRTSFIPEHYGTHS